MSISQKLEKNYKNQINLIKEEKNWINKIKLVGALCLDVGGRCVQSIANVINCSREYVTKCYNIATNKIPFISNKNKCGRKRKTDKYPTLKEDITKIIDEHSLTDPQFKTERQFVKLTLDEIMKRLIEINKYEEGFISRSYLDNLLNEMGYNLKKVKKNKPLKKIKETNDIFDNVHKKREEAMNDNNIALISIDTKDKVLIGPYSRRGKSRILIEACDHELTNRCLIPFGILDLKSNQTYFYNFTNKPTSLAIVDCLEDYIKQNQKYSKICILLDNGPDNSGVRTIFLKGLIDLSNKYKIEIELIYYPPYHSKYNPVERIWARLENIWNGELLISEDICNNFMRNLTWNNVKAKVKFINVEYEKGLTIDKKEMKKLEEQYIIRNQKIQKYSIVISSSKL